MKTSALNLHDPIITGLHEVVKQEYNCCLCDIIGPKDGDPKFIAVFIVSHFYGFRQRDIAIAYTMNFHFIPTVVKRLSELYGVSENFQKKLHRVMNKVEAYEVLD